MLAMRSSRVGSARSWKSPSVALSERDGRIQGPARSAMRRFEYESQVLARLRHPGIAQVFEAGTHDDGSCVVPYFAMEYIPNAKPITQYAKERNLGTRERLKIFLNGMAMIYSLVKSTIPSL